MTSGNESDAEHMSTDMLEDIRDSSQSHLCINRRDTLYKTRYCTKQGQAK